VSGSEPRPTTDRQDAIRRQRKEHAADIRAATTAYISTWRKTWPDPAIAAAMPEDLHARVAGRLIANLILLIAIHNDIDASDLWSRLVATGVMGRPS
jgi:hypothetical protein